MALYVEDGRNSKKGCAVDFSQDGVLCVMDQSYCEVKWKL